MAFWNVGATDKLRAKKVREDGCVVVLSVEVPRDRFKGALEDAFLKIQAKAAVPGFRTGKAPLDVVKQKFSSEAQSLMVDQVIREVLPGVIEEQGLRPVSMPIVHDVAFDEGKPLKFEVSFECPPKVDPRDYKKIPVTRKRQSVTDERVAQEMESLREKNTRLGAVLTETVEKDHIVMVDYQGFLGGAPLEGAKGDSEWVDMAAPQTIAGLTEGILGARRGEMRDFPVSLQDGQKASFKVTVREIKKKVLPNLDDDFAKDLGLSSILEVRAKLREALERSETGKAEKEVEQQIEQHLLKANPIPIPDSIVEAEVRHLFERVKTSLGLSQMSDAEGEDLKKRLKPEAESSVRMGYLLKAIAENEKIAAADAEVEEERRKALEGLEAEEEKKKIAEFFTTHRHQIENFILERKVWKFLKDAAKVKEG
jgi:trigger factor